MLTSLASSPALAGGSQAQRPSSTADVHANVQRYHRVWKAVKDHYYLPERLTDWGRWEHQFDAVLYDQSATRDAIAEMLDSLEDDFCYLKQPEETVEANVKYELKTGCVSFRKLPGNIGYIKIDSFKCKGVVHEVRRALCKLCNADGYVVDLRDNPGGYVKLAYSVFSMFADSDQFATYITRDKDKPSNTELLLTRQSELLVCDGVPYKAARQLNVVKHKPVVALVNEDTRSAAEMLAGALRENGIATLVGVKTFGKGVLQNTLDLDDGSSVKIVIGRYFLPAGECIHGSGIVPDLVVPSSPAGCVDIQLSEALRTIRLHRQLAHCGRDSAHQAGANL